MAEITWHKDNRPRYSKETATINGKTFKTILREEAVSANGRVQRFKTNRVIRDLLDAATAAKKLDLNDIWIRAAKGAYCKAEMQQFYRLIGYSVCGFSEVFVDDEVGSSMWKDKS